MQSQCDPIFVAQVMSNRDNTAEAVGIALLVLAVVVFGAIYGFAKDIGDDPATTFKAVALSVGWCVVIVPLGYLGRNMIRPWATILVLLGTLTIVWSPVVASILLNGTDPDTTAFPL